VGTTAGNALHLDGSTTAVSGLSEDQGCGLYVSSRSQMSPAVLIKGLTGGLGSGIYVRTVVNGIACLLEGSGVGSAMQLTGGSVGNAITLVGGATSGRAISASTTDGDAVYLNAGGAGSAGFRATGTAYGIKALATDTGGIGLFVEGALNGATFLGDNGYGVSMSGSGTAHAGCIITTSSTNADALKLVGNGSGKDISAKEIDNIKTQTDKMAFTVTNQIDCNVIDWKGDAAPAMTGDSFARLGLPAGASIAADIATIVLGEGNVTQINGSASAAAKLAISAGSMTVGTVDTTAFSPTSSQFDTSFTDVTSNQWNDRWIIFTSGALMGEAKPIIGYQLVLGKGRFLTNPFTAAPANGVSFIIV